MAQAEAGQARFVRRRRLHRAARRARPVRRAAASGCPGPDGRLRFAGHVGGGFSDAELRRVARLLAPLETASCPFDASRGQREAALDAAGAGRRGAVRRRHRRRHPARADLPRAARRSSDLGVGRVCSVAHRPTSSAAASRDYARATHPRRSLGRAPDKPPRRAPALARVRDQIDALADAAAASWSSPAAVSLPVTNLGQAPVARARPHEGRPVPSLPGRRARSSCRWCAIARWSCGASPTGSTGTRSSSTARPTTCPRACGGRRFPATSARRIVGGDLDTLLYMVQLAVISQDPWFSRAQSPHEIDFAAIDLDPMEGAPLSRVRDVARWVRDELELARRRRARQDVGRARPAHLPAAAARHAVRGRRSCSAA